jgi:hypothetical protein
MNITVEIVVTDEDFTKLRIDPAEFDMEEFRYCLGVVLQEDHFDDAFRETIRWLRVNKKRDQMEG